MARRISVRQIAGLLRDYAELTKGAYHNADRADGMVRIFFWRASRGRVIVVAGAFHALFGIALVSSGTAALNEVLRIEGRCAHAANCNAPVAFGTNVAWLMP